jgi:hypothetical protein
MALCAYCQAETEMYVGGDVPICVECSDTQGRERKPPGTEQAIRTILHQDLVEATRRSHQALGKFETILDHFPTGLPHPDEAQRIKIVSNELSIARQEMIRAHNRLNDYLSRGIVPEDLKKDSIAKTAGK